MISGLEAVKDCNGIGRYGAGPWMPMIRDGHRFKDPGGILIAAPTEFLGMTPERIVAKLAETGSVSVRFRAAAEAA